MSVPVPTEMFSVIGTDAGSMEAIARPSISFTKDAFNRLKKSKVAIVCTIVLLIIILGAIFIPMFTPYSYSEQNTGFSNKPMFSTDPITGNFYLFGTDELGRDIFTRVWYGARTSMTVAVSVALIDCFVGVVYGGISGYFGGRTDTVMMTSTTKETSVSSGAGSID